MRTISPLDAAWLVLESRDTPMHVACLLEFTEPEGAGPDFLASALVEMRKERQVPPPWNLKLIEGPVVGPRLPLMREERDVDLDYHVRHSALPHPGGQRELGMLVSRLHSNQLDLHRPLWEMHFIEGLEGNRFALYMKMHHSLIDGVSGIRMLLRTLSTDPEERGMDAFWTVGEGSRRRREEDSADGGPLDRVLGAAIGGANAALGLGRAGVRLGTASVDEGPLSAPYTAPASGLGGKLNGQRRFATQQYELALLKELARAAECTLNDVVLYLSSSALRCYLGEHSRIPSRPLTAGIPVNLRDPDDQSAGTAIGFIVADLGTNIADERQRLKAIKASTAEAKSHLQELPSSALTPYTLILNAPYIAALMAGLGGSVPTPFNLAVSNVPGPTEPLYFNGARLDALFPLSLLTHGNALNITCLSYAGTLNFGFTGARDTLPHLQRLAIYMGEALEELVKLVLPKAKQPKPGVASSPPQPPTAAGSKPAAKPKGGARKGTRTRKPAAKGSGGKATSAA